MKCPIDQTELVSRRYEADIEVGACPGCAGMWLERGELEAIQETMEKDYSDELEQMPDLGYNAYELAMAKSGRSLDCPKCGKAMETREYARCSQVMIDVCPACHGLWLDAGELKALELFYERSRLDSGKLRRSFLSGLTDLFR